LKYKQEKEINAIKNEKEKEISDLRFENNWENSNLKNYITELKKGKRDLRKKME